jgi:RHS repeat-associated protein
MKQPVMYTGQVRDYLNDGLPSGLDYFGARYFSSVQGRFTSPDQPFYDQWAHYPQTWNLYTYGRNNPLRYSDPTGTASWEQQGDAEVFVGDYDGEKYCVTKKQCLYWHQKSSSWQSTRPPHEANPGGIAMGVAKDLYNAFAFGYNALGWASDKVDGIPNYTSHRLEYLKSSNQSEQRGMNISMAAGFLGFGVPGMRRLGPAVRTRNVHGGTAAINDVLAGAERFLGGNYKEIAPGVFRSADGLRQVRMTDADILGQHGGGAHVNFEVFDKSNMWKPIENSHVYIK